ncbi:MAG: Holliday junction branch migration protein RuvA [Alphaproteobacteria bacterium]|nr:Holliday junction branch migration protein RuvA [Alphaproteobacteria bacterium]
MIARLAGIVDAIERDRVVIDVNGVGYLVRASARTLATLQGGARAVLLIETNVREDAIDLYGFATAAERDWFRLLTTVQGVGAKVALSLQSALAPGELARAIALGDRTMLTRAEGVGPKLANRIASELKDKVGALGTVATAASPAGARAPAGDDGAAEDAVSALVNLGYRRPEAVGAVEKALARLGPGAKVEALIPEGLKELAR